jgi:hypothetical protein
LEVIEKLPKLFVILNCPVFKLNSIKKRIIRMMFLINQFQTGWNQRAGKDVLKGIIPIHLFTQGFCLMSHKKSLSLLLLSILAVVLSACSLPVTPTVKPTDLVLPTISRPTQTSAAATKTPLPLVITATPPAVAPTQPVTATKSAAITSTPAQVSMTPSPTSFAGTRISMKAGSTAANVSDKLQSGGKISYLVGAQAGQFLMASINSANQSLYLEIRAPGGAVLVAAKDKKSFWQGELPKNGDYQVSVISAEGDGSFELGITIPVRVVFDKGATSDSIKGHVGGRGINTYLLRASKDQTMKVKITSPNNDIFLTIYGLSDGQPYVRSVTGSTEASFTLPSSQDYVIECVSTGDGAEDYTVDFEVK